MAITACRTSMKSHSGRIRREDVDPPPARGLGPPHEARLVEHLVQHGRDGDGVGEVGARLRVEVDAQLVGPVGVGAAHRPGVEVEGAHVGRPQQDGGLGGAERVGRAAAGERDPRRLRVGRRALGQALGVERLAGHAVRVALEVRRAFAQHAQQRVDDRAVVLHDLALRDPGLREVHLVRAGQPHFAGPVRAGHCDQFRRLGRHGWARYRLGCPACRIASTTS